MDNTFIAKMLGTPPRQSRLLELINGFVRRMFPWIRIESAWRGEMANVEARMNLFHFLSQVIAYGVPGDVVEVGCNSGESSVILQKTIQGLDPSRRLHVFDSFRGVPQTSTQDKNVYKTGAMSASEKRFRSNFESVGLPMPFVHAGWFEETLPSQLPDKIAFAFIDGDLYESSLSALNNVYPLMSSEAICMLGIYGAPGKDATITTKPEYKSPGVVLACNEFFEDKPEKVSLLFSGVYTSGYFRKIHKNKLITKG